MMEERSSASFSASGTRAVLAEQGAADVVVTAVILALGGAVPGIEQDAAMGIGDVDLEVDRGFDEAVDSGFDSAPMEIVERAAEFVEIEFARVEFLFEISGQEMGGVDHRFLGGLEVLALDAFGQFVHEEIECPGDDHEDSEQDAGSGAHQRSLSE
jgi:hypothetical protein